MKAISGFDLLKFFMATMIVSMHSNALFPIMKPFRTAAVPTFFVLSSFFLFSKAWKNNFQIGILSKFLKRLSIMYLFWFIVNIFFIVFNKPYFYSYKGIFYFVHDLLFNYTFPGSWFLSALAIAVTIIYLSKKLRIPHYVILGLSLLIYFYLYFHRILPDSYSLVFHFLQNHLRKELGLTFLCAIPWVCVGFYLSRLNLVNNTKYTTIVLIVFLATLIIEELFPETVTLFNVLFVPSLIYLMHKISLPPSNLWLLLRRCSILTFFLHFILLRIMHRYFDINGGHLFVIVLSLSIIISLLIIQLSQKKGFHFLKYSY